MLAAPGRQFLGQFVRLLTSPTVQQGAWSFFSGRSYATGRYRDRDVAVRLQLKRSRYGQGYLVIAMPAGGPSTLDYAGLEGRIRHETGRRALATLANEDLLISVDEGWLKALWQPQGFFIFPGRFSEERWRGVLDAMHTLATSVEGRD